MLMTFRGHAFRTATGIILMLALCPLCSAQILSKLKKQPEANTLDAYLQQARLLSAQPAPGMGSLWNPSGRMSDVASDSKGHASGDLIHIQLSESTSSAAQGSVQTARTYNASSGISAFFGLPVAGSPVANMFSPNSSQTLNGKSQTALTTSLTTTLAANVIEVLPNGLLVVEAQRDVEVSDQHQTLVLHGIVRPEDLSPQNVVLSTAISHMQVSLTGKGVISDGTHPPNAVVRALLRIVGF